MRFRLLAASVLAAAMTGVGALGVAHAAEDKAPVQGQFCPDKKAGQTGVTADGVIVICKIGNNHQEQWLAPDEAPSATPSATKAKTKKPAAKGLASTGV